MEVVNQRGNCSSVFLQPHLCPTRERLRNKGISTIAIHSFQDVALTRNTIVGNGFQPPSSYASVAIELNGGSDIMLLDNLISGNDSVAAIQIIGSDRISFRGDEISNNQGDGIRFVQNVRSAVLSEDSLNPTTIVGNAGLEIRNDQLFEVTTDPLARGNVDARNVWWGTTEIGSIEGSVLDFFDDSFRGIVFHDPIASSAPTHGDFNADGSVDAADYVVWRDGLGLSYVQGHYQLWKSRFGESVENDSEGIAVDAVPEPVSWSLLIVGMVAISLHRFKSLSHG
ncbi:MAG: right-handed parallel beta-helix repeat-containing protein [Pirellulales bacterium]